MHIGMKPTTETIGHTEAGRGSQEPFLGRCFICTAYRRLLSRFLEPSRSVLEEREPLNPADVQKLAKEDKEAFQGACRLQAAVTVSARKAQHWGSALLEWWDSKGKDLLLRGYSDEREEDEDPLEDH